MPTRKITYGRTKSSPMGWRPSHLSFCSGSIAASGSATAADPGALLGADVMASTLRQEFVGSRRRVGECLVDRLVVEHDRGGPGVSERLADLGRVGHVR